MNVRRIAVVIFALVAASGQARSQNSLSACGPRPDSAARQVIKVFSGIRVCLLAAELTSDADFPRDWAARARTLILETQRDGDNRRAVISGSDVAWTINGQIAPQDSLADAWQRAVVDYLDAVFQANEFRRQNAELEAEIDSLPQRIEAAKKRIAYLEDRDRQLNVAILEAGNGENAARADLMRLETQRSAAASRADEARSQAASAKDDRTRKGFEAEARAAEQQASALAENIRYGNRGPSDAGTSRKVAAAQDELRALQPKLNIALLKLQLSNYESTSVADLKQELAQLDAPRLLPLLDAQVEKARLALLAIIEARGRAPSP